MKQTIFLLCLFLSSQLFGQDPADIYYRTLEMDSVNEVSLDVYAGDSLEVKPWAGNHLLIETNVLLENGKPSVLEFFKEQGRWDLVDVLTGEHLSLTSSDMVRRKVETNKGSITEKVGIVIYLPEDFEEIEPKVWRKKEED